MTVQVRTFAHCILHPTSYWKVSQHCDSFLNGLTLPCWMQLCILSIITHTFVSVRESPLQSLRCCCTHLSFFKKSGEKHQIPCGISRLTKVNVSRRVFMFSLNKYCLFINTLCYELEPGYCLQFGVEHKICQYMRKQGQEREIVFYKAVCRAIAF